MKNKFLALCSLSFMTLLSSCDKNFKEINIDATKLTEQNMQYNYLFTSAQLFTAGNANGYSAGTWESSLSYAFTMIQHLSSTSTFWYGDKYIYNANYNASFWRWQYPTGIKTLIDLMNHVRDDEKKKNFYQISRLLKVFQFQRMTDIYGDIPYSEAGVGYTGNLTKPKYDKQRDIYTDMLHELEDAAQKLDAAADNTLGDADLFYSGDVAKWKKFAYSEMVRLAMRMSKVDPAAASIWVTKAVQGGVMGDNDDNAICRHEAKGTNRVSNPVGLQVASREPASYRLSKTFIDFLVSNNDPRLPFFATVVADPSDVDDKGDSDPSLQLGQPNGYDLSSTSKDISNAPNWTGNQNDYSIVNRYTFSREDAPTFLLTYSETQLLLAEAAQRGWITGNAATFFRSGVQAAILQLNQAGAALQIQEADDYATAHPYIPARGLQMINDQYWVATFSDWLETWANWRRSSYPELTPINYQGNTSNGTIPRRFTYPLDEANVNPANYSAALANLNGGDKMTSRVWWDKQ
ncbi:MAG: SusD/RagB family nutrient-binding outer membrane lipoprotein [Ferruginibacter sp.]